MVSDRLGAMRFVGPALLGPLLFACAPVGPNFEQPKPWWSPTSWFGGHSRKGPISQVEIAPPNPNWWSIFHDPELTSLENRIAGTNLDLRVSTLRIAESRTQLALARVDLFPKLNADGSYTRERVSPLGAVAALSGSKAGGGANAASGFASGGNGTFASGGGGFGGNTGTLGAIPASALGVTSIPPFNLFQYGFDSSWELDLWGKTRRAIEAARANEQAIEDTRRNTLISVEAELARDYVLLRGVQHEIQIIRENVQSEEQSLKLTQERATAGLTTELDVQNQRAQVTSTAAQLPSLEAQEQEYINAVSLLLGQLPRNLQAELIRPKPIPLAPPRVPIGLPSELLRRRPDIRNAEAQLHAATADIGVAVADFFPNVSLAGSFGFQALTLGNMFNWNGRQYGFGPTVSLPIFQGGRLTGTLDLRKQQQKEAAINYQRAVLQALHDVDNALVAYRSEQSRRDELVQTVDASRRALALARDRYVRGISSFLDVLDAERTVLTAEVQLNDSTTTISTDLVALYKALGGGWENFYPAEPGRPSGRSGREKL